MQCTCLTNADGACGPQAVAYRMTKNFIIYSYRSYVGLLEMVAGAHMLSGFLQRRPAAVKTAVRLLACVDRQVPTHTQHAARCSAEQSASCALLASSWQKRWQAFGNTPPISCSLLAVWQSLSFLFSLMQSLSSRACNSIDARPGQPPGGCCSVPA